MKLLFQEAKQAENLYRLILDNALDPFIAFDLSGDILDWNRQAEKTFGWRREEVLGKPLAEMIFPPRGRTAFLAALDRYRRRGRTRWLNRRIETAALRRDGGELRMELTVAPIVSPSRTLFFASLRDVSEQRALEVEIQRRGALTISILNSMTGAVVGVDANERLTLVNPAAQRMFGLQPVEQAPDQTLDYFLLFHSDGRPYAREERPLTRALRGERVDGLVALVRHARLRQELWVSANACPLPGGEQASVSAVVVFHDISELKRSQQDFRMLVEGSTDYAIVMLDPQGVILSWNSGAERIFGLAAAEAIGTQVAGLFTREDRNGGEPERELEKARDSGRAENDRWHVRRDGSRFWATGVVTPLWNPDGSLRGYVKIMRDQTVQRLAEEQTQFLANHDMLTGLPNRVHFSNQLHQALALSQRRNMPMAVLLLDLDRFKSVNDTFGHHTGDLLLQEVAQRIRSSIRETDFIARLGGDEFVIIQSEVAQPEAAETLARKLILELSRPYQLEGQEVACGTSVGISLYPSDAKNSVELLKRADLALYRAKEAGRHAYQVYTSELFFAQAWKKDREAALRAALQNHQFELHYQPQIDLASWTISCVEALLRWRAADMEMVLPGEFLGLAEETGLIVEIGEWALREACHQVRRWQQQGLSELRLSINCSARQFGDPRFVAQIPAVLRDAGMAPSSLELEVPEAMLAQHPEIKEQLSELRLLGIRLAIDNFGTGATALTDFQDFDIDVLKIDKTFVRHLPYRREDAAIASAIINLAHNLGIKVVAGGVETAEQLAYLKARDCTGAQGFIFSPPLPAAQLERLMREGAWSRINRMPGASDTAISGPH